MLRVEEIIEYEVPYHVITVYLQASHTDKRIIAKHRVDSTNDWEVKVMNGDSRNVGHINYSLEMVKHINIESRLNQIVVQHFNKVNSVKLMLNGIKYEAMSLSDIYRDLQHRGMIPADMPHDDTEVLTYLLGKYSVNILG